MSLPEYKPLWPETAIFWGAGATADLGISTTGALGKAFYYLGRPEMPLKERVKKAIGERDSEWEEAVADLLLILGDPYVNNQEDSQLELSKVLQRQFSELSEDQRYRRASELKHSYDWKTLYAIIQACPGQNDNEFQLVDLFNLIDMHIENHQGFYAPGVDTHSAFIAVERLVPARNTLKMLTTLIHTLDFQQALKTKKGKLELYSEFAETLYELMLLEGYRLNEQFVEREKRTKRKFYLFSHSFISMNWDPILLWMLFNAHKGHNQSETPPMIGNPKSTFKMFHDLGHFMGVRQIDGDTPEVWYPFNETVVQRINDPDHETGRRVRVGKYYFPHGCSGWRECPNCGKLTMYMGSAWGTDGSSALFPPMPLPKFSFGFAARSAEEEQAQSDGRSDAIQCSFCGTLTEAYHAPLIMQSSFKGKHPSFIEEVQRDMRVSLEGAKHIVLMGYSLPTDDVIYRSILASRKNRANGRLYCSVVGYSNISTNGWVEGKEIDSYIKKLQTRDPESPLLKTIQSVKDLFGTEYIRLCSDGVPNVFLDSAGESVSIGKVRDLLYPEIVFPNREVYRS